MTQRLYLAYGSNLCKAAMRRRCWDARAVGVVVLRDCRLVFRGVADVVASPGDSVSCGLWKISADDERRLDAYEGVASGIYVKRETRLSRKKSRALIYTMTATGVMPPTEAYVDTIRRGYRDFGIDEAELDAAIARSWQENRRAT